jgi:peptidoglycan/xylan/chitin deacetylase (PgdA/CDA1 family)
MKTMVPVILISLAFFSCASSRAVRVREKPVLETERPARGDFPAVSAPEAPARGIDRVRERIKADTDDIRKYFVLDEDGRIIVKADIRDRDDEFEATYDLGDRAWNGDSPLRVRFFLEDTGTGEWQEDFFWWPIREDETGLLLAFDDDYRRSWEEYFELLDQYDARVTYFIQGDGSPGNSPEGLFSFCIRALGRGHDIGYHTIHHLNLLEVSGDVFARETLSALEDFRQAGIPLRAFAYPYGFSEPWMRETLGAFFALQRGFGVTFRIFSEERIREGYIVSRSIDNILFEADAEFEGVITAMLRTLKFIGGVLPLTTHDISDTALWGIKPHRLEYLLTAARALKLRFYRYGDF